MLFVFGAAFYTMGGLGSSTRIVFLGALRIANAFRLLKPFQGTELVLSSAIHDSDVIM